MKASNERVRFLENGSRIQMVEGVYPAGYDKTTSESIRLRI